MRCHRFSARLREDVTLAQFFFALFSARRTMNHIPLVAQIAEQFREYVLHNDRDWWVRGLEGTQFLLEITLCHMTERSGLLNWSSRPQIPFFPFHPEADGSSNSKNDHFDTSRLHISNPGPAGCRASLIETPF